jgi:hypothetical protein
MLKKRGRKSSAELGLVVVDPAHFKPAPPVHMCPECAQVWRQVVDSMRGGWFTAETLPLLEGYVNHAVIARRLQRKIDEVDPDDRRYAKLLRMLCNEAALIDRLARSLRLSKQSSAAPNTPKNEPPNGPRPWDRDDDPPPRYRKPWED